MVMYPGTEDDTCFNITDIKLFIEWHAASPMKDHFQFGEYYHNFLTKAGWLLNQNLISQREQNKLFMQGFNIKFHHQLHTQLCLQDPMHPIDEPWDIGITEQAAHFLLDASGTRNVQTVPMPGQIYAKEFMY
ncbi:hypothetical protein P691DRAFT_689283 [Macrolepiota fuliginosa MF-IS2]|uniref:Uncharacterized protein n=1 Tax=Macrolepiota fuliginosa MF-IS2 TaxID=1400762 RepID=A0A9P5WY60_9AGAR|nr:hypothetical protein P691DRAFT_689283 [Macrolepiota fuliginosa MF-IS2]